MSDASRRELFGGLGAALALALTPVLPGCATLRGPHFGLATDAGQRASLVEALRGRLAALREGIDAPVIRAWVVDRGYAEDLPERVITAAWLSSTFRDLPRPVRRSLEVQEWLKGELPGMAATMFELAELLEGLDEDEREDLTRRIRQEPEVLERLGRGAEFHAHDRQLEPERIEQVRWLSTQTVWRIRHQSLSAVIDDLLARFDRICRRLRVDREDWRAGLAEELPRWEALQFLASSGELDLGHEPELDEDAVVATGGTHLGVALRPRGRRLEVVRIEPGSPAAEAGVRVGDRVTSVDGRRLSGMKLIGWLARQQAGTRVDLEVARDGDAVRVGVSLGAGPGDRLLLERPGAAARARSFRYLSAGSQALGVGPAVTAVGTVMFLVGLLVYAIEGYWSIGAAVLTIVGGLLIVTGLLVWYMEVIEAARKKRRKKKKKKKKKKKGKGKKGKRRIKAVHGS